MKLLILGGTAFLGRAVATHAVAAGHDVTCLARGSAPAPDGVTFVVADRDEQRGLAAIVGHHWDVVVDLSRQPGQVRRAVDELDAEHWVFVSSGNVYARFDTLEQDETAPVLAPLESDVMATMEQYGAARVACEKAIRATSGTATIIRSGLIVGPGDPHGRGGYYVWRFAHPTGPDVLVPPDLDFPTAFIDVDDLAGWIVTAAESRIDGTFNATGQTTSLGTVLRVAREVAGSQAPPARPVPAEVLREQQVQAWMGPRSLPLWIDDPDWRYFATLDTARARAQGLRTRPLAETMQRMLDDEERRSEPRQVALTDDEERALRGVLDAS